MNLNKPLILAQEYLAFVLLNVFDLFLTGWIFRNHMMEGNRLANFVISHFGLIGVVCFKFAVVIFVIIVCEIIAQDNIKTAKHLLVGACLLYLCVVVYECYGIVHFIGGIAPDIDGLLSAPLTSLAPCLVPKV